jgi:hypothetical protein
MTGMICRIKTSATQAARLVRPAGPAHVRGLARLENVATSFPTGCFCIFSALYGALGIAKLEAFGRSALGEQKPHVLMVATSEGPKEAGQELPGSFFCISIVVSCRQTSQ